MRVVKQQSEVAQAFARASWKQKPRLAMDMFAEDVSSETSKFKLWLTASGTSFTWANAIAPSERHQKSLKWHRHRAWMRNYENDYTTMP